MLVNWPNELTDGPPIFYFHVRKSTYVCTCMYVAPRILFPRGGHFLILIHHSSFPSTWHEPKQRTVLPRYWGRETKMISSVGTTIQSLHDKWDQWCTLHFGWMVSLAGESHVVSGTNKRSSQFPPEPVSAPRSVSLGKSQIPNTTYRAMTVLLSRDSRDTALLFGSQAQLILAL